MLDDSAPYDKVLDLNEDGIISSADYLAAKRIEMAYSDPEQKSYTLRIREYMLDDPNTRVYDAQLDINWNCKGRRREDRRMGGWGDGRLLRVWFGS